MLELWLKYKASTSLIAWVAPQVRQWNEDQKAAAPVTEEQLEKAVVATRPSSPDRLRLQLQLADAQRIHAAGDPEKLDQAEATIRAAIEVAAAASNSLAYLECLDALAQVYHDRQDFVHMQALIEEGIRLEASLPHPNHARMAQRMHGLGLARHQQGEDAAPILEKAVELHEQAFGEEALETGHPLADLGIVYRSQQRHEEACASLERALRIHGRAIGYTSPEALRDVDNLACTLAESGDVPRAIEVYDRALELMDRIVGADPDEVAEMQFTVATLYVEWEHYAGARELLAMCLGTFKRKKGPRLAVAYELAANIEEISGRYLSALAELERAAKIWQACGVERLEELANNLEYRANLLEELHRHDSAEWLREKAAAARAGQAI
jgi:tetratricopeptide (TPR) repeat protein